MPYKLEVIAFDIESCKQIEQSGAHRIELCANPYEGGTTPSHGTIKMARQLTHIDLFPIIRPRGGDFIYTDEEWTIMADDIRWCREVGCNGVVLGLLQQNGDVDLLRTAKLVALAYPMEVTFHRAFDHCRDPFATLAQLINIGCQRVLTSGQQPKAIAGARLLAQLVKAAEGQITIMPGSGVCPENVAELAQKTGAVEFHASLRKEAVSQMNYATPAFADAIEKQVRVTVNEESIEQMVALLAKLDAKDSLKN